MRRVAIPFAVMACAISGTLYYAQVEIPDSERSTVTVEPVEAFDGELLANAHVRLLTLDRRTELASGSGRLRLNSVQYGRYIVRVSSPGSRMRERLVTVNTPKVWIRIGVPLHWGDEVGFPGDYLTIRGQIRSARGPMEEFWVSVHGVFLPDRRESPVGRDGKFEVSGLDMGTYLLEVFDGARLLLAKKVELDTRKPVTEVSIKLEDTSSEAQQ